MKKYMTITMLISKKPYILTLIILSFIFLIFVSYEIEALQQFTTSGVQGISIAPLSDNSFVVAWCNSTGADVVFGVYNSSGSTITNPVNVDTNVGACNSRAVSVSAFNSTTFVIGYGDRTGFDYETYQLAVYNIDGTLMAGATTIYTGDTYHLSVDIHVSAINSTHFFVGYSISPESGDWMYYEVRDNNLNSILGATQVESYGGTQYTSNIWALNSTTAALGYVTNGGDPDYNYEIWDISGTRLLDDNTVDSTGDSTTSISISSFNYSTFVYAWDDEATSDDAKFGIYTSSGATIKSGVTVDINIGDSGFVSVSVINESAFAYLYYDDDNSDDITLGVYDSSGNVISSLTDIAGVGEASLDVASQDTPTSIGFCNDNIIVAYSNSSGGYFDTFHPDLTAWSGDCIGSNAPTYNNFQNNATSIYINGNVNWSINPADDYGLSGYYFAHNNSGTLMNVSNGSLSGTSAFINNTITITKGRGNYICGQYTFNDSQNQWSQTLLTDTGACFTVNNSIPIIASTELNKTSGVINTDDLNCSAVGKADADTDDTTTYHYEWYNNSVAIGLDSVKLSNTYLNDGETWYCEAWVTDGYDNSSKYTSTNVNVGSGSISPVIIIMNATTSTTGINSSSVNPTNNNSWLNFSVFFSDANAADVHTAYFCNTPTWSDCQNNVSSAVFCKSENNQSLKSLSCQYELQGYSGTNPRTFYGFVIDNASLVSAIKINTFEVNYPPPIATFIYPTINSYIRKNHTIINWTATDTNGDTINYTLYVQSTGNYELFYNGTNKGYNFTNAVEYTTYSIKIFTIDQHGYGINNATIGNFTMDFTKPNISVSSPTTTTYDTATVTLTMDAADFAIDLCNYSIYYRYTEGTILKESSTANCQGSTVISSPYYDGGYSLDIFAYDKAGNYNSTQINFTTEASTPPIGGSGGGNPPPQKQCESDVDCEIYGAKYVCIQNYCVYQEYAPVCNYNGICEPELGETLFNCGDELLDNETILVGDCHAFNLADISKLALSSQWFVWIMFILFIILIIFLFESDKKSVIRKYYIRRRKKWN